MGAVRPDDAGCMNWDAYSYVSADKDCNDVWFNWDMACIMYWTEECDELELMMEMWVDEEEDEEEDWYMLATKGAAQKSTFGGDFGKGAAIGAVAALVGLYAFNKFSGKKAESEEFQRA